MQSVFKRLFVVTLTLGLGTMAMSVPSLLGPTGLLFIPTCETVKMGQANASVSIIHDADDPAYSFNSGVSNNLEVGFTRLWSKETIVNAKYNLMAEDAKKIGLSLGVIDVTDQLNSTFYLVASKKLEISDLYGIDNFHVNVGVASGDKDGALPLDGLFGGVSVTVAKSLTVMLEGDGNSFNYGARANIAKNFDLTAGVVGDNHDLALGASYTAKF